jgi:signal transduction histidine kinase
VPWRAVAYAVLSAEAAERSRIATAVHDDTVQVMAATLVLLDRIAQMAERHADMELEALLAEARSVVGDATERTRRLAFELWPAVLYEHGLAAAITTMVEQAGREIGAQVSISVPPERFERRVEEVVFRTVQEAIANIRKHSRANRITVDVREVDNGLEVVVDDDGCGFDVSTPSNQLKEIPHMGLAAMRERVRMSGGAIHIHSSGGSGTRVTFQVPLS